MLDDIGSVQARFAEMNRVTKERADQSERSILPGLWLQESDDLLTWIHLTMALKLYGLEGSEQSAESFRET
jgi:hypothetical protein